MRIYCFWVHARFTESGNHHPSPGRSIGEAGADAVRDSCSGGCDRRQAEPSAPYVVAPVEELSYLVTEASAGEAVLKKYRKLGITVLTA